MNTVIKKQHAAHGLRREGAGERVFNCFNYLFLTLLGVILLYPLYYVIAASFTDTNYLISSADKMLLYPHNATVEAYKVVLKYPLIWNGYKNTIFIAAVGVLVNMAMTIMGGYYISRKDLLFRNFIVKAVLLTMFFSGGLIPNYLLVKSLGLLNSPFALILPGAISTYNMIIMRSAFDAIPSELTDAVEIDGGNDVVLLWNILVPITIPTIMVLVLYYLVGHWNSWFPAMIYMSDKERWPLQLVLRKILIETSELSGEAGSDVQSIGEAVKYAVIVVSTIPVLAVYPLIQKHFVKGAMIGSLKG